MMFRNTIKEGSKQCKFSKRTRQFTFIHLSLLMILILTFLSWLYIVQVDQASLFKFFSEKNLIFTKKFIANLLGINNSQPAFLDWSSWKSALGLTYQTLEMSIMAIGFAAIGMLITVIPAARTTADGSLTLKHKWNGWLVYGIIRVLYVFSRSVPELIWAMMIIFIFKPGILPGAIALAIHNFGTLGKLCAEVIEDLDLRPIRSLASAGAGKFQLLIYGILPTVFPKFITYILYRWEVIIRTTVVVGFVGAGGLGMQFKLSMSWFHYTEITLFLICYLILVFFADMLSESLRKAIQ